MEKNKIIREETREELQRIKQMSDSDAYKLAHKWIKNEIKKHKNKKRNTGSEGSDAT